MDVTNPIPNFPTSPNNPPNFEIQILEIGLTLQKFEKCNNSIVGKNPKITPILISTKLFGENIGSFNDTNSTFSFMGNTPLASPTIVTPPTDVLTT